MRCQDNIKENLIKPVLTPNVVTLTEKNFPATLTICAEYLQFLNDGTTFWKRSETPPKARNSHLAQRFSGATTKGQARYPEYNSK